MSRALSDGPATATAPLPPRRVRVLLAAMLLLLAAVSTRTIWLQSVKNRSLSSYAQGQQQNTLDLPAVRGNILDRNGQELAIGEEAVTFYATPKLVKDPVSTAVRVARLLDLDRVEEEALVERLSTATGGFAYVARQVPRPKADALEEAAIPGIGWYDEQRRMYPQGTVAGQLLGTVNIDNVGIEGVEALYDHSLTGQPGKQVVVRDLTGTPIDVLDLQRERDGRDVQLTIDSTIQSELERVLVQTRRQFSARSATGIVLDPRSGEILAMAGVPRVNPSKWSSASGEARRMRAITDTYEPGSTFKVVTISAALEEGVVTPETSFRLAPSIRVCDESKYCVIKDSHDRPTEWMTTERILVESSNVGTITIARDQLGAKKVDEWVRRYGFGAPTGIDFPGEVRGLMLPLDQWSGSTIGNVPIGQGIGVTPIQLISAYAAIANDGVLIKPHLLKRIGDEPEARYPGRRIVSVKTARTMRRMFGKVVTADRGTGTAAAIPGYAVGGKTGTANVAEKGHYVKGRYIASFVGFVPAANPQLVTLVVVNEPNQPWGGVVAAPAFEQVTEFALSYLAIPPDGRL